MPKLWAGRVSADTDRQADGFNSSIAFDCRMVREDIAGSMAHAAMLGARGIIPQADAGAILEGLAGIQKDLDSGALSIDMTAEDIHMFIESELTKRIGDAGKRLHTGRSRNDQVATDLRLYAKKELSALTGETAALITALLGHAKVHLESVMPGYTHLQRAQPVTLAHHLMAWCEMLSRDMTRLRDAGARMDACPLGSGALAGTTYPLDRERTALDLGFAGITRNTLDSVSDRDYCIEILAALSILMTHLSRMSEELILWCSSEFGFVTLDDAFSTGSSIMPQKKNPDVCELIRGKTGRVYGHLMGTLAMMKGLPLAYNKDMQEDKEAFFGALDTARICLATFTPMLKTVAFHPEKMRHAAAAGFINATDCADYLVKKGLPFREAYGLIGRLVAGCSETGQTLETLPLERYQSLSGLFDEDVYDALKLENCVARRNIPGGPAPGAVAAHIRQMEDWLNVMMFAAAI